MLTFAQMLTFALLSQVMLDEIWWLRWVPGSGAWMKGWHWFSITLTVERKASVTYRQNRTCINYHKSHPLISLVYYALLNGNYGSMFLPYSRQCGWLIYGKMLAKFSTQWDSLVLFFEISLVCISNWRLAWATWESVSKISHNAYMLIKTLYTN